MTFGLGQWVPNPGPWAGSGGHHDLSPGEWSLPFHPGGLSVTPQIAPSASMVSRKHQEVGWRVLLAIRLDFTTTASISELIC